MIPSFSGQLSLSFFSETTNNLIQTLRDVQTDQIQVDGPEKVFGKIFDEIGLGIELNDEVVKKQMRTDEPGHFLPTPEWDSRRGVNDRLHLVQPPCIVRFGKLIS